ncbi:arginine--tRNA ligase [Candidatus Gottesmanbacteria bacterium]|nr:arginine--tRNA ligase [Candidatus Gottesmanbacteria bacterium]
MKQGSKKVNQEKPILSRDKEVNPVVKLWQENKNALSYKIREYIFQQLIILYPELKDLLTLKDINLEYPVNEKFGDYASNVALILASRLKQSPRVLAEKIVKKMTRILEEVRINTDRKENKERLDVTQVIDKVEVAGSGFINLWLQRSYFGTQLSQVLSNSFGSRTTPFITENSGIIIDRKKVMIEFAHPNTHKEFHIGHLRNISIGESLVRILQTAGGELFRANYEGDVGLHVAKAIWGVREKMENGKWKMENGLKMANEEKKVRVLGDLRKLSPSAKAKFLGEAYALGSKAYEEDDLAKKDIIDLNKNIYKDPKSVELWEETRGWSLEYFDWVYKRLGTHFDRLFFESEVEESGRKLVTSNLKTGIFIKDTDGSIYWPGENYGLNNCVFVTRENYATYEGKDVALEHLEYEIFPYDLDIHVVANEQKNFFEIAFAALGQIFPYQKGRQYHLAYGMVNLKGEKLSSRTGQVVTADWLIDQAKEKIRGIILKTNQLEGPAARVSHESVQNQPVANDAPGFKASEPPHGSPSLASPPRSNYLQPTEIEEIAEKVAVGAVKYSMLKVNPRMDIAFDLEESVSLEGDSGPYLQYTYARCKSVLRKAQSQSKSVGSSRSQLEAVEVSSKGVYHNIPNLYQVLSDEELSLLRNFVKFADVVGEAGRTLCPNLIGSYLFGLAQKYNLFYNKHSILNPESSQSQSKSVPAKGGVGQESVREFRLALTQATANILKQGLYLLGIETVERM